MMSRESSKGNAPVTIITSVSLRAGTRHHGDRRDPLLVQPSGVQYQILT